MTILMLVIVALAGESAPDACAVPADVAGAAADPAAAAMYRAVGDDERAAGDDAGARAAYAAAIARDPNDERARAALADLCRAGSPAPDPAALDHFQDGLDRMNRGDRSGAIAAFEAARADGPDPAAALLEGICYYEQGRDQEARALFQQAREDRRAASDAASKIAGTASLFLGLIALHDEDSARASELFQAAQITDAGLSASLAGLSRLARRDGRLVVSALAEVGYDSNVSLVPDGTATATGAGDGYTLGTVGLFARPLGASGPYARLLGQYRKQLQITAYDLGDVGGAAGYRLGRPSQSVAAEYGYDYLTLGQAAYLSAQRLAAEGRLTRGAMALRASYAAAWESFLTGAAAPYSGVLQNIDAEADWQLSAPWTIGLGYHVAPDSARDPALSFLEQGPLALLRYGGADKTRGILGGSLLVRHYDAPDPDLGVTRSDVYLDLGLTGERDLSDRWTGRLTLSARRALSNVPAFQYTKVMAAIAFTYSGGLL
jgi:tetratricopeptide (TPR) repeat protein